jgi:ribonuclease Z
MTLAEGRGVNIIGPVGIKRMLEAVLSVSGGFYLFPLYIHEIPPNTHMNNILLNHESNVIISAAPLVHRVPTVGYSIQEQSRAGTMLADKAKALGVYGQEFRILKAGNDVTPMRLLIYAVMLMC